MITIICQKGIIDAIGCRLHIKGYNLTLTRLDNKDANFVVSQFSDEASAEATYKHIMDAIKEGNRSVDIRDVEKWKSTLG